MPKPGELIAGKYEIRKRLGHGGQGSVWSAVDRTSEIDETKKQGYMGMVRASEETSGGTPILGINIVYPFMTRSGKVAQPNCAIKFLNNPDEKAIERLKIDYRAVKALDDPRIIKYHDFDIPADRGDTGESWIKMELVVGSDLQKKIKAGDYRLNLLASLELFVEIVDAVGVAHANTDPIIHRDLKPANILLREDRTPVVSDFGICSIIDGNPVFLTSTGEEVGARNYIAPELRGGFPEKPTAQSDIYSLGKILYCMLSGGIVMDAEEFAEGKYDLLKYDGSPEQMVYVYNRLFPKSICRNIDGRFPSAREFVEEIKEVKALIEEHFYPVKDGMKCKFCGGGKYISQKNLDEKSEWLFICDKCGNAQLFYNSNYRQQLLDR